MPWGWPPPPRPPRVATAGERFLASFVDGFAISSLFYGMFLAGAVVAFPLGLSDDAVNVLLWVIVAVVPVAYWVVPTAVWGRSFGKWMAGTRVVTAHEGRPPGFGRSSLRFLVFGPCWFLGIPALVLGLIALGQERHRTVWDFAGGTCVLTVPPRPRAR
ncbi:RDD family protein [Halostreptopolyspora alba]|uniref:RDD family protein n=1 Tax=Halostreptopolyspora alba TaxID=2487137 RepID=UPI0026A49377